MYTELEIAERESLLVRYSSRQSFYLVTEGLPSVPGRYLYCREFFKLLHGAGIDFQDWVDHNILGIFSHQDRPKCKCPGCTNTAAFVPKWRRYRNYCSQECQLKHRHSNPESIKKQADAMRVVWSSPEYKSRMADIHRRLWMSEAYRNAVMDALHRAASDPNDRRHSPEFARKVSDALYRSWLDEEVRSRRSHANELRWKSEEQKELVSQNMIRYWSDPANRDKLSNKIKSIWSDPDGIYNEPGYREKKSIVSAINATNLTTQYDNGDITTTKSNKSTIHYKSSYERDYIKSLSPILM